MNHNRAGQITLLCLCAILLLLSLTPSYSYADDNRSVSEAIKNGGLSTTSPGATGNPADAGAAGTLGAQTSGWGFLLQVIFSLGLIVVLIYLLLKFLGNKQLGNFTQKGPVKILSTVPMGNGKNMQIVMIADSLYILGVGNDVTLIRYIPSGEEADVILSEVEMTPPTRGILSSLLSWRKQRSEQEQDIVIEQGRVSESFEQLLGQKWDEVKRSNVNTPPRDKENDQSGERL